MCIMYEDCICELCLVSQKGISRFVIKREKKNLITMPSIFVRNHSGILIRIACEYVVGSGVQKQHFSAYIDNQSISKP